MGEVGRAPGTFLGGRRKVQGIEPKSVYNTVLIVSEYAVLAPLLISGALAMWRAVTNLFWDE
jgi:hypothetical protein